MSVWTMDTESDGFVEHATVIHCAVLKELDTGVKVFFDPDNVKNLPEFLEENCSTIIVHNGIQHDFPLIKKVLGYDYNGKVYDTLVLSRILSPNRRVPFNCTVPGLAPHSLGAWGYRVGRGKVEYNDWANYSDAMLHRCEEDVEINELVYLKLQEEMKDGDWSTAVPMTMKLFQVFKEVSDYGWKVDEPHMHHCIHRLNGIISRISEFLYDSLPYVYVVDEVKVKGVYGCVKKPFLKSGTYSSNMELWFLNSSGDSHEQIDRMFDKEVGGPFTRLHYRKLSLDKRVEVIKMLLDAGWIPDKWNYNDDDEKTSPKLSKDDDFVGVDGAFGRHIVRRVQARHRRSNIMGLFKLIRPDGRISSRISGLAETARVKHTGIVNVPNVDSFFGKDFRKIFTHEEGKVLVGVDSSGNQVRQLCARMGDDKYEYEVLHGDVHSTNQKAAGLATRSNAKRFFYSFLFGAGDAKVGSIVQGSAADGKRLKENFLAGLPKLDELINNLKEEWRNHAKKREGKWGRVEYYNGWVSGLDGRPLYIKSEHAILVYVLQNMEAIQMSYALLFTRKWLEAQGLTFGKEYGIVAFVHDELNVECEPQYAKQIGETIKRAIIYAGKFLGISTPHDGDIKIGENWFQIH